MDSLTWMGCVTLWKSESRLPPIPGAQERASRFALLKTNPRPRNRKTRVSVNARGLVGYGFLEISIILSYSRR